MKTQQKLQRFIVNLVAPGRWGSKTPMKEFNTYQEAVSYKEELTKTDPRFTYTISPVNIGDNILL